MFDRDLFSSGLILIASQITYLDEYYLTNYEIEVLKQNAAAIAEQIPAGSMVIELGSGLADSQSNVKVYSDL